MDILYWFESIRNPITDAFFSVVTFFGHELIPIALVCVLYWCIDKKLAYKVGFVFFASNIAVQTLKITFRIDRPWIKDPNFKPVGNAVDEATSYSFPSGHTQAAASVYGSFAIAFKKIWLKVVCIVILLLVGISRMYLGVHTLADVAVSMIMTLVLAGIVFWAIEKVYDNRRADIFVSLILFVASAAMIIYSVVLMNKGVISQEPVVDCVKSGASGLAFAIGYFVERRYIDFSVKCSKWWMHIVKVAIGLAIALGLKSGLKPIVGETILGDGIRYFVLVGFVAFGYPLIIKLVSKRKSRKEI